jgi:hypothetical protein
VRTGQDHWVQTPVQTKRKVFTPAYNKTVGSAVRFYRGAATCNMGDVRTVAGGVRDRGEFKDLWELWIKDGDLPLLLLRRDRSFVWPQSLGYSGTTSSGMEGGGGCARYGTGSLVHDTSPAAVAPVLHCTFQGHVASTWTVNAKVTVTCVSCHCALVPYCNEPRACSVWPLNLPKTVW